MCAVHEDDDGLALILGGTRGLGRAIVSELNRRGLYPIAVGRSAPDDPRKNGLIKADKCGFMNADLSDPACAEKTVGAFKTSEWPKAFYWVAGEYHRGPFSEQDPAKTASMLATHIAGPLAVLQAFHKEAVRRKSPYTLVVIGSVFVHKPGKKHAMLAAAKAFKANFARVFAYELAEDLPGSSVLLVNPWAMKTEFFDGYPMDAKAVAGFMDVDEVARIVCTEAEKVPKDVKPPMVELTLDRDKDNPGAILRLLGPQPVKY